MIKTLRIQNIILVEHAHINFSVGLNILTGETGSGKSAIMNGLGLAVGERSDVAMIRKGCEKGTVEAVFDCENDLILQKLLEECGIDCDSSQEIIIKREISISGKHRLFINHQPAQLVLLKKIGVHLANIVGQHANHQLFSIDFHREVLDLFGDLEPLLLKFKLRYEQESIIRKKLSELNNQEAQRLREIDRLKIEIEELDEAQLKKGEDEELFSEYSLLVNGKELSEKIQEINRALSGEKQAVLTVLNRTKGILDSLVTIDPNFRETALAFQNAFLELQEISHTMLKYQDSIQNDPYRIDTVNDRLSLINKLKRKYGTTIEEIQVYYEEIIAKLNFLENADIHMEELTAQLQKLEADTNTLAENLTSKRQDFSKKLSVALTKQLASLNMPKASFIVNVSSQKRTSHGDDKVEFFLQPNVGEHQIPLRDAASGGEVARVLLAIQTLLAGKAKIKTLIFDEVDANIGGETASIVGEKLREIASQHQVICVTHFPQVATKAHHHFQIYKHEKEGRTLTEVRSLDASSQPKELERMMGIIN